MHFILITERERYSKHNTRENQARAPLERRVSCVQSRDPQKNPVKPTVLDPLLYSTEDYTGPRARLSLNLELYNLTCNNLILSINDGPRPVP